MKGSWEGTGDAEEGDTEKLENKVEKVKSENRVKWQNETPKNNNVTTR